MSTGLENEMVPSPAKEWKLSEVQEKHLAWLARTHKDHESFELFKRLGFPDRIVNLAQPDPHQPKEDPDSVHDRVARLKIIADDPDTDPQQIPNILKAITMLESGELFPDSPQVCFQDGAVIEWNKAVWGRPVWYEVRRDSSGKKY